MKLDSSTIYYNGNTKLKKAGVRQAMTVFEQQEFVKCKFDVIYFIKNYVQIISLDEGVVPFHLFPYQEKMIKHMEDNRFSILMLGRQMGKTITTAAYILHQLIFNKSFSAAILANKGAQAREIMERIQLMYEELPFFLQPGVKTWNKGSISLGNGSKAFTAATSSSSVRGKSINLLYCVTGDTRIVFEDDAGHIYSERIDKIPSYKNYTGGYVHKGLDKYEYHIVYKITNTTNGKIYVGVHSTDDLDDGYMGSGRLIRAAIEKYGIASFSKVILRKFETRADAYLYEKEIVDDVFIARDDTYNLRTGGHGGMMLDPISGSKHHMYGVNFSDEHRKKISDALIGRICDHNQEINKRPEKIAKTAESHRGMTRSVEARENMSVARKRFILKNGAAANKGSTIWHDPATGELKTVHKGCAAPDGWLRGTGKSSAQAGKKWFTDGTTNLSCKPGDEPSGFIAGRTNRSKK